MNPAALATLKDDLFGRHFETLHLDCNQGDQLTRELQDFIRCVRTGERPRVPGQEGRNAVALATRILESLRAHSWDGSADGPVGPRHLPAPLGPLFQPRADEAAA